MPVRPKLSLQLEFYQLEQDRVPRLLWTCQADLDLFKRATKWPSLIQPSADSLKLNRDRQMRDICGALPALLLNGGSLETKPNLWRGSSIYLHVIRIPVFEKDNPDMSPAHNNSSINRSIGALLDHLRPTVLVSIELSAGKGEPQIRANMVCSAEQVSAVVVSDPKPWAASAQKSQAVISASLLKFARPPAKLRPSDLPVQRARNYLSHRMDRNSSDANASTG